MCEAIWEQGIMTLRLWKLQSSVVGKLVWGPYGVWLGALLGWDKVSVGCNAKSNWAWHCLLTDY